MAGGLGNYALFTGGPFVIATLIPDVVIEAVGQDALGITGYSTPTPLPRRARKNLGWFSQGGLTLS